MSSFSTGLCVILSNHRILLLEFFNPLHPPISFHVFLCLEKEGDERGGEKEKVRFPVRKGGKGKLYCSNSQKDKEKGKGAFPSQEKKKTSNEEDVRIPVPCSPPTT